MLLFDSSFGSFARSFAPFWVIFVFVCVFIWFGFHFQLFALLTIKFFHPHFSWIHRFLVHFEFPHCNFQFSNEFSIFICKQTSSPLHWYSFLFSFFFEFISFTFTFYTIIFENSHLKKKTTEKEWYSSKWGYLFGIFLCIKCRIFTNSKTHFIFSLVCSPYLCLFFAILFITQPNEYIVHFRYFWCALATSEHHCFHPFLFLKYQTQQN